MMKNLTIPLILTAVFLIAPLFLATQTIFAGQIGTQTGPPTAGPCRNDNCEQNCTFNPNLPACPLRTNREQKQFAAAQIRNERVQPPNGDLSSGGETPTRSNFTFFSSTFVLFGGIWLLIILLKQKFGTRLRAVRARLPKIARFVFRPTFSLSIGVILLATAIAGNVLTAPPQATFAAESNQQQVQDASNSPRQSDINFTIKNMFNFKLTNIAILFFAAFFLLAPLFLTVPSVFAGAPSCQGGEPINPCDSRNPPETCPTPTPGPKQNFAAAQMRRERNRPPNGGLSSGETHTRSNFTFFASIFVLLGGLWTLFALLRNRFGKRGQTSKARTVKVWDFAFKPSFALSAFGFLFLATIVGGVLTKPSAVSAEKRVKADKSAMTGLINPSNKPVFKTTQQIGGSGITQIGAPVFDSTGNRYVRGGFTGTLTIGATTLTATKDFDLFVAKYDAGGNALWARQASGSTSNSIPATQAIEGATALSVDASGNVYIGGVFVKTITLQGGANSITLSDNGAAGINYESFVAKYDANGNLLWARGGNTNSPKDLNNLEDGQNGIDQIVFDQSGNPYVAGFVSGNQFLGSPFTNQGLTDIMLAKLNPATGAVDWKQIIGGTEDDNGLDLKIDGANNLYLIGNYGSPTISFPNGETFTNPGDPEDFEGDSTNTFVAKFDATGANLWTKSVGGGSDVGASQIAVNGVGEIFMTGYFFDSVTFGATTLVENEGTGEDSEASYGGFVTKMDAGGTFVWAKQFGGIGEAIALDGGGRIHVAGKFFDGGAFGEGTPNAENLASFGGEDLFVARYDASGNFDFAKPIAGAGAEGEIAVPNPSDENGGKTENNYNPLGIAYNPATQTMFVSGDFQKVIALDCETLTTTGTNRHSYVSELSADGEQTSCRIWNGLDADDNNFDSPDNWNGGIIPNNNDSIYVPYTGNSFDNPIYNPTGIGIIVNNLTVSDDRTLTVERDLPIVGKLWLLGGFVNTGADRLLDLTDTATANRISDADGNGGYIIGKIRKEFGNTNPFTFPVGTSNGYSPIDVNPQFGIGALLAIKAVEQPQPLFATSPNRINRYWEINKAGKGFIEANLTFHYLQTDVVGDESQFVLFKVEDGDAMPQTAMIDTAANTATVNNVSEFSDWTLAQLAPTAAQVEVGGRVTTANGQGISRVRISMTDANGVSHFAMTNAFGYYKFEDVAVGQTVVLEARHKRYSFASQIVTVNEVIENLDFVVSVARL